MTGVSITPMPAVALPRFRPTPSWATRAAAAACATRGREWDCCRPSPCVRCWRSRQPASPHLIVLLPVLPVWLLAICPAVSVVYPDPPMTLAMRPRARRATMSVPTPPSGREAPASSLLLHPHNRTYVLYIQRLAP